MKVIMTASDPYPGRPPKKPVKRYMVPAATCAAAVVLAAGVAVTHVFAAGGQDLDVPAPAVMQDAAGTVPDMAPDQADVLDIADGPESGPATEQAQVCASSSQSPYVLLDTSMDDSLPLDPGTSQEEPRQDAAAEQADTDVQDVQDISQELADAKRELEAVRRELDAAKQQVQADQSEASEPVTDPEAVMPADPEPPAWLFVDADDATGDMDQGIPEWLVFQDEPEVPEWIVDTLDMALYKNPYDGGPLCQQTYVQAPCPVAGADTRLYVDAGMPVTEISQPDLLQFVSSAVRGCDASWATVAGTDGFGYQFMGCDVNLAAYGPVDEYGQVAVPVYYLVLTEDGYVVIS